MIKIFDYGCLLNTNIKVSMIQKGSPNPTSGNPDNTSLDRKAFSSHKVVNAGYSQAIQLYLFLNLLFKVKATAGEIRRIRTIIAIISSWRKDSVKENPLLTLTA
ncbi:hypothetical protein TNO021_370005 [Tenacibaculum dicentrarchi]|nr:hypothetical protein TNO021_370005 [Tenacibaculum dicentrarchi]